MNCAHTKTEHGVVTRVCRQTVPYENASVQRALSTHISDIFCCTHCLCDTVQFTATQHELIAGSVRQKTELNKMVHDMELVLL